MSRDVLPTVVCPLIVCCMTMFASSARADEVALPPAIAEFLGAHCVSCHGGEKPKAGVALESTPFRRNDQQSIHFWMNVHDQLVSGAMPPKARPQPSADERKSVIDWLHGELQSASFARQKREGRVLIRRLNAMEYQHTLQDLLGVTTIVKDLLPEDAIVAGFDKVSSGLETSGVHLVRYQQAAERAIADALTPGPRRTLVQRITGKQRWDGYSPPGRPEQQMSADLHLRYSARLEGETIVFHQQTESNGYLEMEFGGDIPAPGRYRLRASVSARNTGNRPLPVLLFWHGFRSDTDPSLQRIIAMRDAIPGRSTVIEEEVIVTSTRPRGPGGRIALKGWTLPGQKHPDEIKKDIAAKKEPMFDGPGLAVDWVEIEGPLDVWPSPGYRQLFGDLPLSKDGKEPVSTHPKEDAERLIRRFLPIAFRRPVSEELMKPFITFAHVRIDRGDGFFEAMKTTYKGILCSPHFLNLIESPGPLDDHAIASRLSYSLWGSTPDQALMARADRKELRDPKILRAEVERLLNHPRSARFTQDFTDQWLDLRKLHATQPDPAYIEFDHRLMWAIGQEPRHFFREVLVNDRSVLEFVQSDWTMLNERLATHYGIPGVNGDEFRRVKLPPRSHRGGMITQAAVLKVTANGTSTSPVIRGAWVLDRIIGQPPPPPPPDIPALEPDIRGARTIREQLEKHRQLAACASCHAKIDPPGFALESFDVIGGWRDWYRARPDGFGAIEPKQQIALANYPKLKVWRGPTVEPGYQTPDGARFTDIDEYKAILLKSPDQITRNLTRKLVVYATGGPIEFADRAIIERLVAESRKSGNGFRSLIHAIVQSDLFLNK